MAIALSRKCAAGIEYHKFIPGAPVGYWYTVWVSSSNLAGTPFLYEVFSSEKIDIRSGCDVFYVICSFR